MPWSGKPVFSDTRAYEQVMAIEEGRTPASAGSAV
jgi:hypothetical protein